MGTATLSRELEPQGGRRAGPVESGGDGRGTVSRVQAFIPGPSGRLEAILWDPAAGAPARAACVVCHPHPQGGGTMRSTVVYRAAQALRDAGAVVLRFNFRGVGLSAGEHSGGGGEAEDALAALDWLARRHPAAELWAAGYSFGARAAAAVASRDRRVARVVLIALPVAAIDCAAVEGVRAPGLVIQAERDDFGGLARLRALYPRLYPGLELAEVAGADHFFAGRMAELQELVGSAARRWLETPA